MVESGTIKSREQIILKNELEGNAIILSVVEEGTHVKSGDLLIQLDSSKLVDYRLDYAIITENSEAALIKEREDVAVAKLPAHVEIAAEVP